MQSSQQVATGKVAKEATEGRTPALRDAARKSRFILPLLMTSALAGTGASYPLPAWAQAVAQQTSWNIPAQPLSRALVQFSGRSGLQLFFDANLVRGMASPGVSGSMTRDQALARLLAGTDLSYAFTNANTVTITDRVAAAHDGPPSAADGSLVLDTIEVNAGGGGAFSPDTPYRTAGSSTYISREQIERSRGTSVGDFLQGAPGIINADNRAANALDVNIRGMQGQGRAPVIIDGAIQESTVYRGYNGIAGRTYLDPDFIGSVSIEKGPSAKADATGAIGGVVRASTIAAEDILLPGKSYGIRVKGSFNSNSATPPAFGTPGGLHGRLFYSNLADIPSSFGGPDGMDRPGLLLPTGFSGSIAAAATSENFDFVAAYARRKNGNYFAGSKGEEPTATAVPTNSPPGYNINYEGLTRYRLGEEVLNTSSDSASFLLKGTLKLGDAHRLEVAYNDYRSDYGEMMPSSIIRGDGSFQNDLSNVHSGSWTAKYKFNPDTDLVNLNINLFHTDVENRINTAYCQAPYGCAPQPYALKNIRWGATIDNTSEFDTAIGDFSFNYGGAFTHEDVSPLDGGNSQDRNGWRREWSGFLAAKYKPVDWLTLNASARYSDFKSQDRSGRTGIYRIYRYQEADGSIIELNFDERQAYLAMGGSGTYLGLQTFRPTNDEPHTGSGVAPMFSALVEPVQGLQFYGQYSEAIRLPSLFETTTGWSTDMGQGFPDKPEHARNWEFGINWMRDGVLTEGDKLRFKASYFDNTVDDYITRIYSGDSSARAQLVNIDYAKLRGFEISASYDSGRLFGDVAWTHYTYTNYCTKSGQIGNTKYNDLCYAGGIPNGFVVNQVPPKDAISLTVGARLFDEKLTLGSKITYVGKRPANGLDSDNVNVGGTLDHYEWKPYTVADLFASYQVNENFQVDMAVDNVTDQYYVDTLALGFVPAPGRTFRLSMTAKF